MHLVLVHIPLPAHHMHAQPMAVHLLLQRQQQHRQLHTFSARGLVPAPADGAAGFGIRLSLLVVCPSIRTRLQFNMTTEQTAVEGPLPDAAQKLAMILSAEGDTYTQ